MSSTTNDAFHPRLCHIRKWSDLNSYGFNLHADMGKAGQYVGSIDKNSPAEAGGLLSGDRIIEVNGVNICNEYHVQVVERIKSNPDEVKLLVVTPEADEYFKNLKVVVSSDMDGVVHCEAPPTNPFNSEVVHLDDKFALKSCELHLWSDFTGYGFNVQGLEGKSGHFVGTVDENSPAQLSGLKENDRILEVNHQDVCTKVHKTVVDLIRSGQSSVQLLVVDPETENYLKKNGIILPSKLPYVQECKGPLFNPNIKIEVIDTPVISIHEDTVDAPLQPSPVQNRHLRTASNGSILEQQQKLFDGQSQRGISPTLSEDSTLQLACSAREARERMAKKKNVKDTGLSIRDKFQILQEL